MNYNNGILRCLLGLIFLGLVAFCWCNDKSFTSFMHVYATLGIGIAKVRALSMLGPQR